MIQEFRSLEGIVTFVVTETQKKLKEKGKAPEPKGALAETQPINLRGVFND